MCDKVRDGRPVGFSWCTVYCLYEVTNPVRHDKKQREKPLQRHISLATATTHQVQLLDEEWPGHRTRTVLANRPRFHPFFTLLPRRFRRRVEMRRRFRVSSSPWPALIRKQMLYFGNMYAQSITQQRMWYLVDLNEGNVVFVRCSLFFFPPSCC